MNLLAQILLLFTIFSGPAAEKQAYRQVIIQPKETATQTIDRLCAEKLLKNCLVTHWYVRLSGLDKKIRPGTYSLSPHVDLKTIIDTLTAGPLDIWLTFPEGWRREQYALRLKNNLPDFDIKEFLALTDNMEGMLFPDTYLISRSATPSSVVKVMVATFSKKTNLDVSQPETKDIITLASLIERETRSNEENEKAIVAGIIKKRLKNNWPLQIDATVQYGRDSLTCARSLDQCKWWSTLTNTKLPTVYNTYINLGLPPTPIANPGLNSITAALYPVDSEFWFYIHGNDGKIRYARTLEEHNLNIDKYLKR